MSRLESVVDVASMSREGLPPNRAAWSGWRTWCRLGANLVPAWCRLLVWILFGPNKVSITPRLSSDLHTGTGSSLANLTIASIDLTIA
ncbi:MAG: hypothetical protein WCJ02_07445 [bacterium]